MEGKKRSFIDLFLISAAMAMKACSTLVAFLALVSMNGIPISSANAFKDSRKHKAQTSEH